MAFEHGGELRRHQCIPFTVSHPCRPRGIRILGAVSLMFKIHDRPFVFLKNSIIPNIMNALVSNEKKTT